MKRFKSILCASLLTLAISSIALGGDLTGRSSNLSRPGDLTGKPGDLTGKPGDLTGLKGDLTGRAELTAIDAEIYSVITGFLGSILV